MDAILLEMFRRHLAFFLLSLPVLFCLHETAAATGTTRIFVNGLEGSSFRFTNSTAAEIRIESSFFRSTIFYSLDGSEPDFSKELYSTPFLVASNVVVRAVSYSLDLEEAKAGPVTIELANPSDTFLTTRSFGFGRITRVADKLGYRPDEEVTLTAVPEEFFRFTRWSDGTTNNPRTVRASATNYYGASFELNEPVEEVLVKEWDKTYGGNYMDGNGHIMEYSISAGEVLQGLTLTEDGGYLLVGSSSAPPSGTKTSPLYSPYRNDGWVVRTDAEGNQLWDRTFGGNDWDNLFFVQRALDGNYILGGHSESPPSGNKTSALFGDRDFWAIKITPAGAVIWDQTYGGEKMEFLQGM